MECFDLMGVRQAVARGRIGSNLSMTDYTFYDNPLVTRYASREMAELWGSQRKFGSCAGCG